MEHQITYYFLDRKNALHCNIFGLNQYEIAIAIIYVSKGLSHSHK